MTHYTVAIACDHAGVVLKNDLISQLEAMGHRVLNLGTDTNDSVDYPDYAVKMAEALKEGRAEYGVLICGTGIGISIAANRFSHVRAALCHNVMTAELSREHNNANVLVLGARVVDQTTARDCVNAFFSTAFGGGRHATRVAKMS